MDLETVLVVEDEALLMTLVAAEFEDAGLHVLQAVTAEAALDLLRDETAIEVLFADIRLPGAMDGWKLAEEARRLRPEIKVIYATGYSIEAPRPVPGSMFFNKPYRPSAILAAMRSLTSAPDHEDPSTGRA